MGIKHSIDGTTKPTLNAIKHVSASVVPDGYLSIMRNAQSASSGLTSVLDSTEGSYFNGQLAATDCPGLKSALASVKRFSLERQVATAAVPESFREQMRGISDYFSGPGASAANAVIPTTETIARFSAQLQHIVSEAAAFAESQPRLHRAEISQETVAAIERRTAAYVSESEAIERLIDAKARLKELEQ